MYEVINYRVVYFPLVSYHVKDCNDKFIIVYLILKIVRYGTGLCSRHSHMKKLIVSNFSYASTITEAIDTNFMLNKDKKT